MTTIYSSENAQRRASDSEGCIEERDPQEALRQYKTSTSLLMELLGRSPPASRDSNAFADVARRLPAASGDGQANGETLIL